jgi:hypothetical protein
MSRYCVDRRVPVVRCVGLDLERRLLEGGSAEPLARPQRCMKTSIRGEIASQGRNPLTVHRDGLSIRAGARERWCTMRDEFASKGFFAVTVAGLVLLCSGFVAFAFT